MKNLIVIIAWFSLGTTAFAACPQGTTLNKTTKNCEAEVACKHGNYNPDMWSCESLPAKNECPDGTKLDRMNGVCIADPTCPAGTIFDGKKGLCLGAQH